MDPFSVLRSLAALLLVLGLLGGLFWVLRRFSSFSPAGSAAADLKVISWRPFDGRKRLAVIRWGDEEHLILTGQAQDLHISSRPAQDPRPEDVRDESGETS